MTSRTLPFTLALLIGCGGTVTPRTEPADVAALDAPGEMSVVDDRSQGERPVAQDATSDDATIDATSDDATSDAMGDVATSDVASDVPVAIDAPATDVPVPTDVSVDAATVNREATGPHLIGLWTGAIPGATGTARVFYPTTAGVERYPLVAFAHGFQLTVGNYDLLLRHLASYGYVVASIDYPNSLFAFDHRSVPAALSAARLAFGESRVAGFPASARVDASRAVAMGHSAGGKGAVMAVLDDPGFIAGLVLDPVDDDPSPGGMVSAMRPSIAPERMAMLRVPLGVFGSSLGRCAGFGGACAPEASNWLQFVVSAPAGVAHPFWVPNNFGHNDFLDPGCFGACSLCAAGSANDAQRRAVRAISVAFLDRYARGDASAQPLLDGAGRVAYVAAGTLWDGTLSGMTRCP